MKFGQRIVTFIFFVFILFFLQKFSNSSINPPSPLPTQSQPGVQGVSSSACHIQGVFPDPNCTPGVIDPNVTQENIFQTICIAGYTKTIRPSVEYTNKLKIQQIQEYGYVDTDPRHYEEDHLISLELGGSPTNPKNLWPEPSTSPNPKDKIENLCHQKVCSGELSLAEVQKEIATNWQTACK